MFQIIILIWLVLLTISLGLLTALFLAWIKHHNAVDARVKDLEQDKRGNPFVKKGSETIQQHKKEGSQNG